MMIRTALFALALAALVPAAQAADALSPAQKTEIEGIVKQYIMDNPQVILDAVEKHQTDQMEKSQAEQQDKVAGFVKTLGKDYNRYVGGNPKGDITIVEFFDYNCGYCKKAFSEVNELIKEDKNVRVIFLDMPILGPQSTEASKWSLAAANQGKYFEYHRALMDHQGPKTPEALEKLAQDLGLDVKKLKEEKESEEISKLIGANIEQAQAMGFNGTPGFIIGDEPSFGYIPLDTMKATIKAQREGGSKEKTDG